MDTKHSESANLNDIYQLSKTPPQNTKKGDKVPIVKSEHVEDVIDDVTRNSSPMFKEGKPKDVIEEDYYYKGPGSNRRQYGEKNFTDYVTYTVCKKAPERFLGTRYTNCITTGYITTFYFVLEKEKSTKGGKRKSSKKSKKSKRKTKQKKAKKRTKRRKH